MQRFRSTPFKGQKVVFFDLKNIGLEVYYYSLMFSFQEAGYFIFLNDNFWFLANCGHIEAHLTKLRSKRIISNLKDIDVSKSVLIYDEKTNYLSCQWHKTVHLNADIYNYTHQPGHIKHPFHMAPHLYAGGHYKSVSLLRKKERTMRICFSGNLDPEAYSSRIFESYFKKLNRIQVIDTLLSRLDRERLHLVGKGGLPKEDYTNKFVLFKWSWSQQKQENLSTRIENNNWLPHLATSHFFLCPPGIRMPLCFHTIEAMSVGTIPILEYPEFFDPPLEHMKNAIVFSGREDLIKKINLLLALEIDQINSITQNVCSYYERYLIPEATAMLINSSPNASVELFINGGEKSYTNEMVMKS